MTVLIVSAAADVHAQAVMQALAAEGARAELVDLSEFPTVLALSMAFEVGGRRFELRRRSGGVLDLDAVRAVWWRRPQPFRLPSGMDEAHERFALSEAATAFHGLYQALSAFWINEPARDAVAAHKAYQLALAQEIGLDIPVTLMTNDEEQARAFWRKHEGEVIYKQFIGLPEAWRATQRLRPEDEAHAGSIAYAPVIFQKHVPAVADLRVTVVDGEFYAAAADVREGDYPQDVRMNLDAIYEAHELPPEMKEKLGELMTQLGLVYGAIDMRLTPDGCYVFLEINPAGQFLYIEQATGQPIAAALAKTLLKENAANSPPQTAQAELQRNSRPTNSTGKDERALQDANVGQQVFPGCRTLLLSCLSSAPECQNIYRK
jgi:glutathione synthase/RimK-type ligase-like ATP-grasp enzyme